MADTLRELVTRFGFQVDKSGVNRFNQTVGGMKKQVLGLATALGVGFGGRELLRFGTDVKQTEVALKTAVSGIEGGFELVDSAIEKTRANLGEIGEIITPQEGRAIAVSFFGEFQDVSADMIGIFDTLFRAAAIKATSSGTNVSQVFAQAFADAKASSVASLKGISGVTIETEGKLKLLSDVLGELEPTGVQKILLNLRNVAGVLDEVLPENEKFVRENAKSLLALRQTSAELEEGLQSFGAKAVKALQGPLDVLSDFIDKLNEGKGVTDAFAQSFAKIEIPQGTRDVLVSLGILDDPEKIKKERENADRIKKAREKLEQSIRDRPAVEAAGTEIFKSALAKDEGPTPTGAPRIQPEGATPAAPVGISALDPEEVSPTQRRIQAAQRSAVDQPPTTVAPSLFQGPPLTSTTITRPNPPPDRSKISTQAPMRDDIAQLISALNLALETRTSQGKNVDAKLQITVTHEGRVLTFPDEAALQRFIGDLVAGVAVEFTPGETTAVGGF